MSKKEKIQSLTDKIRYQEILAKIAACQFNIAKIKMAEKTKELAKLKSELSKLTSKDA